MSQQQQKNEVQNQTVFFSLTVSSARLVIKGKKMFCFSIAWTLIVFCANFHRLSVIYIWSDLTWYLFFFAPLSLIIITVNKTSSIYHLQSLYITLWVSQICALAKRLSLPPKKTENSSWRIFFYFLFKIKMRKSFGFH